jgi:hypothetical protein
MQLTAVLIVALSSCKKDSTPQKTTVKDGTPVSLGLFESKNDGISRIQIPISKVGTKTVNYDPIFDTGSTGLTIGTKGVIDSSLVTANGINIVGDSVISNGVTITSTTSTMEYGDATNSTTEYGNLAYASITIPNEGSAGITIKRVPIFLYYKIVEKTNGKITNTLIGSHSADIFGVGPGVSYTNSTIASPLSYYSPGGDLTIGFKLTVLNSADFTTSPTYVPNLLTVGLTQADLTSSGFIMHPLTFASQGGYSPDIPGTITYNNKTIAAVLLFDTGTPQVTIIEDKTAALTPLPVNTTVTVTTNKGFTYTYVTASANDLTSTQNPNDSGDNRSIFSIDFFVKNEALTDYTNHQIGLKNN